MSTTLAERIEMILSEKGIKPAEMAERLGVASTTPWRWAKGETKPSRKDLHAIADAFGYHAEWLISGEGEKYALPGQLTQRELDALGNAAIVFRDADTGKVFFTIDFPSYMRVWNPYLITVKEPNVDNGKTEMFEKDQNADGS
jgi:transcriptional regulator with XRE-family HTH domain